MAEEEKTHNVFDQAPSVPVVIYTKGQRKVIGNAHIEQGSDGVSIQMDLDSNDPEIAAAFLQNLSHLSIGNSDVEDLANSPNPHTAYDHKHEPYDHEDGLVDWCDICHLTVGFMNPRPDDWRKRMLES